jgi:hypothetical protein
MEIFVKNPFLLLNINNLKYLHIDVIKWKNAS